MGISFALLTTLHPMSFISKQASPQHPKQQKTITFHESFVKVSDLVSNRLETSGLASKQNIDSLTSEMLLNVCSHIKPSPNSFLFRLFSHILCFLFITVISGRYIQKFLRENRALHRVNRNQGFQLNFFQKTE